MKILVVLIALVFSSMIIYGILDLLSIGITLLDIVPYQTRGTQWYKLTNEELFERFINDLIILVLGIFTFLCYYFFQKFTYKKDENTEEKEIYFSICPKCKETFNYDELENGKCKYCEDVDTVDIEQYYKDNPKEKEKGNSQ